jgi:hypothetical protein
MVNSEELIATAEHTTLQARCRTNRCRYNRVLVHILTNRQLTPWRCIDQWNYLIRKMLYRDMQQHSSTKYDHAAGAWNRIVANMKTSTALPTESKCRLWIASKTYRYRVRVDSHYTARHDTTRSNILSWFSHARIRISPSATANDRDSVVGFERREHFTCLLTDGRCECTLVFVVSCRVVPYNVNRP